MRARLISLTTTERDGDSLSSVPPQAGPFAIGIRALVGPSDGSGEESFDLTVCSPDWLAAELVKGFRWGHGLLIVAKWDAEVVERAVRDLVLHTEGSDWHEVAEKLARYTHWEFADYRP
jgi:hypothetical protein